MREIPPLYLLILAVMLAALGAGLYTLAAKAPGGWGITVGLLLLLLLLHTRRRDYRFLFHIEERPGRVFAVEYLLLALPVSVIECVQGQWLAAIALVVGCGGIALIGQPVQTTGKGVPVPRWIPVELFEIRSGFRQSGIVMIVLYVVAYAGLLVPYLPLAFLFFYTCCYGGFYGLSEPVSILCARELPTGTFLHRKLWVNGAAYFLTLLPVCALYAVLQPGQAWYAGLFLLTGTLNICLMIVTKYAYYRPQAKIVAGQMSLSLSLAGMVAPFLAPLTLFFCIKNYLAARRNLTTWLYAYYP